MQCVSEAQLTEGQIYEGRVSVSGADGPYARWIIVAPFGRVQAYSIDRLYELRCLPIFPLQQGLRNGLLKYVETEPEHPLVQLQQIKELNQVRDTHLGLAGDSLEKMFAILEEAVANGRAYTPYAATEILALLNETLYTEKERQAVYARVYKLLPDAEPQSNHAD